jgi:signal transduction histidine kinase
MPKLFLQLYLRLVLCLVLISASSITFLLSWAGNRFETYVVNHAEPVTALAIEPWAAFSANEKFQWLKLLSSLTDASWTLNSQSQNEALLIRESDWSTKQAEISIRLDEQHSLNVRISNWTDWHYGYGWLLLNAISQVPATEREALFNQLNESAIWPALRVDKSQQPLSELDLLQLNNGQPVRTSISKETGDLFYFPAGAEQVISIGPIDTFNFLSTEQWLAVVSVNLIALTIVLAWLIRPLHLRISAIINGVERVHDNESDIHLPASEKDDLGLLALRIEQMAKRLQAQVEQNLQLNRAVSHDLKTPLSRLKFALSIAEQNPVAEQFNRLNHEVDLLTDLTNELLIFHQLSATRNHAKESTDVVDVLDRLLKPLEGQHLSITHSIGNNIPRINISENHWRRICQNLLDNAQQYGNGKIHVGLHMRKHALELSVADNGPGVSEEDFQRLLQPFSRGDTSRNLNNKNHGLGLSLVNAIANHYRGSVSLSSSELAGARFIIKLPI